MTTYKEAGVSIENGNKLVRDIALDVTLTWRPGADSGAPMGQPPLSFDEWNWVVYEEAVAILDSLKQKDREIKEGIEYLRKIRDIVVKNRKLYGEDE